MTSIPLPVIDAQPQPPEEIPALQSEIRGLARRRNAVILAHNYQRPEVQDVADFVGDSLGLSRQAAKTDADVQKLTGVLVGLSAALSGADHEVNQATASAVVQDIANRADERRQVEAKKEQQHAEFTEAVEKYGKTFRLLTEPVKFPTR